MSECGHCKGTGFKPTRKTKPKKAKHLCLGCENNFYNGNNPYGVDECWSFKKGKVIKRLSIPTHRPPPYDKKDWRYMLDCYHQKQMCYPNPDAIAKNGCWNY